MNSQEIELIARTHSHLYEKDSFNNLKGIYKELASSILGDSIYCIKDDTDEYLKQLGWQLKESAVFVKTDLTYHAFTALGYEELIRFMTNPKKYVNEIPSFNWTIEYDRNNQHYYNILRYLLEFSLHYGIKFE